MQQPSSRFAAATGSLDSLKQAAAYGDGRWNDGAVKQAAAECAGVPEIAQAVQLLMSLPR